MREAETLSDEMQADLALIAGAAEEAGRIAMRYFGKDPEVWMKSGKSPVSEADLAVDRFLKDALTSARGDYGWLSEETADTHERLGQPRTFVVDPIDGTKAFLDGQDVWCVSIAVVENGRSIAGVLDCPARGEVFTAMRGRGALRDGTPLAVRLPAGRARVAGPKPMLESIPEELRRGIERVGYVPSLAYRVAMVASGRIDATFVRANAHDWDVAAADLILGEAGGAILDRRGQRPYYAGANPRLGALVAGSGDLLAAMAGIIAESGDD